MHLIIAWASHALSSLESKVSCTRGIMYFIWYFSQSAARLGEYLRNATKLVNLPNEDN